MTDFFQHRDNLTSWIEDAFHLYLIVDDWNDRPQCTRFFCHSDSIWVRFLARSQIAVILLENVICVDSIFTTFSLPINDLATSIPLVHASSYGSSSSSAASKALTSAFSSCALGVRRLVTASRNFVRTSGDNESNS